MLSLEVNKANQILQPLHGHSSVIWTLQKQTPPQIEIFVLRVFFDAQLLSLWYFLCFYILWFSYNIPVSYVLWKCINVCMWNSSWFVTLCVISLMFLILSLWILTLRLRRNFLRKKHNSPFCALTTAYREVAESCIYLTNPPEPLFAVLASSRWSWSGAEQLRMSETT